ncbi:hypothetical protein [Legionella spiritensis]|uniref:Transmembrane protein n=1 Tax=Legionella spiritensis TaxID=452 RepID=A0A0W0YW06_LEGSP|nr:hypothetical protein [Legionella spiritensis]KTD61088.1 hypothetical protein Lspi_2708 [Legionella spiritensis]SNV44814.1 Uncharacterised protein [Legionella spiritensis]
MNNTANTRTYALFYIKLGFLLFFACWFAIACLTNLVDLANAIHLTNEWAFHSGNLAALAKVLAIYHTPTWFLYALFCSDIIVQGTSAVLFAVASWQFGINRYPWPWINTAFGISMALWATFLVMEEIFIAYAFEATHIRLLILEMAALLVVHGLPHHTSETL